jgi:hypothetical protein
METTGLNARSTLTLRDAATVCGVSFDTIKRDRAAGVYPNAAQDERGFWTIPAGDLVAAGRLDASALVVAGRTLAAARESQALRDARERIVELEALLAARDARIEDLLEDRKAFRVALTGLAKAA